MWVGLYAYTIQLLLIQSLLSQHKPKVWSHVPGCENRKTPWLTVHSEMVYQGYPGLFDCIETHSWIVLRFSDINEVDRLRLAYPHSVIRAFTEIAAWRHTAMNRFVSSV